ncbi:MAG: hypothetical protein HPY50_20000 [Firmicutes bacterium]|nr:hypothetical protein [Bacillota bacterium]
MAVKNSNTLHDQVRIVLPGAEVRFQREYGGDENHEITVVLPRVEIKKSLSLFGAVVYSREVVVNSLTVVDAPHPPIDQPVSGRLKIAYR